MGMTQQEAYDLAVKMRNQKATWPKIAEALEKGGYVSARTGKPIGHLMVRHMVTAVEKKEKEIARKDEKERAPVIVGGSDNDVLAGLQKILAMHDIPAKMRTEFAKHWLNNVAQ